MKKHAIWLLLVALILTTAVAVAATENGSEVSTYATGGSISSAVEGSGSITTFFNSNNSFAGNMFDIQNIGSDPITITSFDVNLGAGTGVLISVFSVPGTYLGNESNPGPWTLMGTDTVDSNGTNIPTPVAVGGLTINPGETYGLYVTASNYPAASMLYTNGANVVSNTEVQLTLGAGKGNPDFTGSTFTPRSWNGTIYYDIEVSGGPAIDIEKSPDFQQVLVDGTADFTITVTNTGDVTLEDVTVSDALTPSCDSSLGDMTSGAVTTYNCSATNVVANFTNTAVVTSTYMNEDGPTDSDDAVVEVIDASLVIDKSPDLQTVPNGGTADFTITVTNTGSYQVDNVTVSDALVPSCDNAIGSLPPGNSVSYTCSDVGVTASYTNTAVVTGVVDFPVPPLTDSDDAYVDVPGPTDVSLTNFGQSPVGLSPIWLAAVLGIVLGLGLLIRRRFQN